MLIMDVCPFVTRPDNIKGIFSFSGEMTMTTDKSPTANESPRLRKLTRKPALLVLQRPLNDVHKVINFKHLEDVDARTR